MLSVFRILVNVSLIPAPITHKYPIVFENGAFHPGKNIITINNAPKINKFGIPEPISSKKFYPDILLVPLVGYDNDLNRLGYGGGFYDRYIEKIEKIKKVIKIGLAFSCQKIKNIPLSKYDKKLDFIITEKEILKWEYYF